LTKGIGWWLSTNMIKLTEFPKGGGGLAALFMGEMLTASATQHYEADLARPSC
jgi:hypothetical protein